MAMTMAASSKPKRQRKWHYTKPLHTSQKEFSVHLSRDLRKELGRRSLEARKGDTVKVLRGGGKVKGKQGKITGILRAKRMVYVEGIMRKKVDGTEKAIPLRPSNLLLIAVDTKDERRMQKRDAKGAAIAGTQAKHGAEGGKAAASHGNVSGAVKHGQ